MLKTAFRLEKVKGQWIVRDVRIGHNEWEKVSSLAAALEGGKNRRNQGVIGSNCRGDPEIPKSRRQHARIQRLHSLVRSAFAEVYMMPLIRIDSWRQPIEAERQDADSIQLRSAGPDGKIGTPDDIRLTVTR